MTVVGGFQAQPDSAQPHNQCQQCQQCQQCRQCQQCQQCQNRDGATLTTHVTSLRKIKFPTFLTTPGADPKARVPPVFLPQIGRLTPMRSALSASGRRHPDGGIVGSAADHARSSASLTRATTGLPWTRSSGSAALIDWSWAPGRIRSRLPVIASVDERLSAVLKSSSAAPAFNLIHLARPWRYPDGHRLQLSRCRFGVCSTWASPMPS